MVTALTIVNDVRCLLCGDVAIPASYCSWPPSLRLSLHFCD
jgi:hypothetical protein